MDTLADRIQSTRDLPTLNMGRAACADSGFSLRALAVAATVLCCTAAQAAHCDLLEQRLTTRQAAKFTLTRATCPVEAPSAGASPQSPAANNTVPLREHAEQLSLYGRGGVPLFETIAAAPLPSVAVVLPGRSGPGLPAGAAAPLKNAALGSSARRAMALSGEIDMVALKHDIDPLFLHSIAHVESRHDAQAVSRAGAMGVMQVMPATARRLGVPVAERLRDPRTNLEVSATYLKLLQKRFGNDLDLVLAGYNAGEGAVERYGRSVPPFAETRDYVVKVRSHYRSLLAASRAVRGESPGSAAEAGRAP